MFFIPVTLKVTTSYFWLRFWLWLPVLIPRRICVVDKAGVVKFRIVVRLDHSSSFGLHRSILFAGIFPKRVTRSKAVNKRLVVRGGTLKVFLATMKDLGVPLRHTVNVALSTYASLDLGGVSSFDSITANDLAKKAVRWNSLM